MQVGCKSTASISERGYLERYQSLFKPSESGCMHYFHSFEILHSLVRLCIGTGNRSQHVGDSKS